MANWTILHFTESLGGGVASAINDYRRSTPEFRHHLIGGLRSGELHDDRVAGFDTVRVATHTRQLGRALRKGVTTLRPDIVHLHSSVGGAIGRLVLGGKRRPAIVYSPHCYAFERLDMPRTARLLAQGIERALARRSDVIACCSQHEAVLALRLGSREASYIPNVGDAAGAITGHLAQRAKAEGQRSEVAQIGMIGRAVAQKDPDFFVQLCRHPLLSGHQFVWIGDGPPAERARLEAAGVRVTGWLTSTQLRNELRGLDAYVHTAAWEGFPISLLEANHMRVPALARPIAAFEAIAKSLLPQSLDDMARAVTRLTSSAEAARENIRDWDEALVTNTADRQAASLRESYRRALEARGRCTH